MTTPHWVAINLVNECGADTPKIGTFCAVLGHATYLSDAIGTDLFLSLFLRSLLKIQFIQSDTWMLEGLGRCFSIRFQKMAFLRRKIIFKAILLMTED
ncbi:hypothetical protein PhaeoP83_03702 [Phaeobacter inhibens]|uniref:Uncharacterized protein n=1 Tax=Phaeobacter inhibens TaxID=221822 RepID=A0ABN5GT14_9RHOB|nr:hypothetical protein PhaeoP83_03702 [Phaeobacter inhibens]AUQ96525.1 hypothetical protein PhaeoP66_03798 [Phaeobacter inhibens]AUR21726.1 hypothetical protein PhaeoP80_03702 [Phaeobacter inhibens]